MKKRSLDTRVVHAGETNIQGSLSVPIFQSSTYLLDGDSAYEDIRYGRMSNSPTHDALHAKLADLESGEAALVFASGMAAISTTLLTYLRSGDHLVAQDTLYGGTWGVVHDELARNGIEVSHFPGSEPQTIEDLVRPETRLVYSEAITNPLVQVTDHHRVVEIARKHDIPIAIDNTFASPINFRPLEHGYDISIHSATKYLNGHTDLIAGCVVGSADHVSRIRATSLHLGGTLNSISGYFLYRGLKTLALRIRRHNETGLALARALDRHPRVRKVNHPGLESSQGHEVARELFDGFGGMLSFELDGSGDEAVRLMRGLSLATSAPSLGGVETLVSRPATTSHASLSPEDRTARGISDSLIRISTGIEDTDELIADFTEAIDAL